MPTPGLAILSINNGSDTSQPPVSLATCSTGGGAYRGLVAEAGYVDPWLACTNYVLLNARECSLLSDVRFDGVSAERVFPVEFSGFDGTWNHYYVRCVPPAHAAGVVDVTIVLSNGDTATLPACFEYGAPAVVTSITPAFALNASRATVTLHGSGFLGASRADGLGQAGEVGIGTIADLMGNDFQAYHVPLTVIDDATATCVLPVWAPLTNPDGRSEDAYVWVRTVFRGAGEAGTTFRFVGPPLPLPTNVPVGGATVTVRGFDFQYVVSGTLDGVPVTLMAIDDTHLGVAFPAHAGGWATLRLVDSFGEVGFGDVYFFTVPDPETLSVSTGRRAAPGAGLFIYPAAAAPGATIFVVSTGLVRPVTTVTFTPAGSLIAIPAAGFSVVDDHTLSVTVPLTLPRGAATLRLHPVDWRPVPVTWWKCNGNMNDAAGSWNLTADGSPFGHETPPGFTAGLLWPQAGDFRVGATAHAINTPFQPLPGAASHLDAGWSALSSASYTIRWWTKMPYPGAMAGHTTPFYVGSWYDPPGGYLLQFDGHQMLVHYANAPGGSQDQLTMVAGSPIDTGWHRITLTQNGSACALWFDDVRVATGATLHSPPVLGFDWDTVTLGRQSWAASLGAGWMSYDGLIQDFMIVGRVMADAEMVMTDTGSFNARGRQPVLYVHT